MDSCFRLNHAATQQSKKSILESIVDVITVWADNRSKDPKTKVGAAVYTTDGNMFIGYNGFPKATQDMTDVWYETNPKYCKHDFVIHAEMNAILKAVKSNSSLAAGILVVTLFPCTNCIKLAAAAGIREIIYVDNKGATSIIKAKAEIMGVRLTHFKPAKRKGMDHA